MLQPLKETFQYEMSVVREVAKSFPHLDFSSSILATFIASNHPDEHCGYLAGKTSVVTWRFRHTTNVYHTTMLPHPLDSRPPRQILEDDLVQKKL